jgi:hypothetical protein
LVKIELTLESLWSINRLDKKWIDAGAISRTSGKEGAKENPYP